MANAMNNACKQWGMTISAAKTKTLTVGGQQTNSQPPIMLQSQPLRRWSHFLIYLSSEICQSSKAEKEVHISDTGEGWLSILDMVNEIL